MNRQDVERIMLLASCDEEEAIEALSKTNNIIDAVDMIIHVPISRGAPKEKIISEEQAAFTELRKNMEAVENNIMMSNQFDSSSQELTHNHVLDQEEMTLRSDCIQSSRIPTQEEEEQIQEIACQ